MTLYLEILVKVFISLCRWIKLILYMIVDVGLKCYAVPSQFTCVTLRSGSQTLKFFVKLLVKVFISQYLLNMLMDQVDALHVDRYWSQVLCCSVPL